MFLSYLCTVIILFVGDFAFTMLDEEKKINEAWRLF